LQIKIDSFAGQNQLPRRPKSTPSQAKIGDKSYAIGTFFWSELNAERKDIFKHFGMIVLLLVLSKDWVVLEIIIFKIFD
jgi:hypothetical protein